MTDIRELLGRYGLRVTPQRRAILEAFRGTLDEHLSAEEVLSRASAAVPDIGRGTVYGTLAELAELGLLSSVGDAEPVRYETNLAVHDHFGCRQCLRLFDVDLGGALRRTRGLDGYTVESLAVHAEGVCADCHAYGRGLSDGSRSMLEQPVLGDGDLSGLSCARLASPLGDVAVAASSDGIIRLAFEDHADFPQLSDWARRRRGPAAARDRIRSLDVALNEYYEGSQARLTDVIDSRMTSRAAQPVFTAARDIPYNGHHSYQLLSSEVPAYEIGRLMGSNPWPVVVPCHRVSCGSLRCEQWVGGTARLDLLHELEAR